MARARCLQFTSPIGHTSLAMATADTDQSGCDLLIEGGVLIDGSGAERVRADLKEGVQAGVRGTPSFFVGLTDPTDPGKITATRFIRGAQRFAVFQQAIEEMTKQASSTVEAPALQN